MSSLVRPRVESSRPGTPAVLLLYAALAALLLWPFRGLDLKAAGDLHAVVASVVEAGNALAEGQFPLRVAPNQLGGTRYPFFQFYGNFPFTLAGALDHVPGVGPYAAWKLVMGAALVCGGLFTFRCAARLSGRRGRLSAVVAGAAFMAAPYMLTNIYARGAFAEAVAFNLLPALSFYVWRAFVAGGAARVLATAVAWALVGLTHNITYLYASLFLGLFFLTFVPRRIARAPKYVRRASRLAIACLLQGAILAWYFVPQLYTVKQLNITLETRNQPHSRVLGRVPMKVLLAPVMTPLPTTANLGAQIGWPVLLGAAAMAMVVVTRAGARFRGIAVRLLLLFGLSCAMAWSPVDFWRVLPEAMRFVQFPYRMLAFATLWGTLLTAVALRAWMPGGLRPWQAAVLLAGVGLAASTYRPSRLPGDPNAVARAIERPAMGGLNDYLVARDGAGPDVYPTEPPALPPVRGGPNLRYRASSEVESLLRLPVLYYPRLLDVQLDKRPVAYGRDGPLVAVTVPPGEHRIDVRFAGITWANGVSLAAVTCVGLSTIVVLVNARRRRRSRRSGRGRARLERFARELSAAVVGVAVFAAGLSGPAVYAWAANVLNPPVAVAVFATRTSSPHNAVDLAFDGDPVTEWAAAGSQPITLTISPARPGVLRRVVLESRAGGLYEAWQHVRVDLFRGGALVASREFAVPEAADQLAVTLEPPAVELDRIEFHFSEPVTKLRDGTRHVDANAVNPGYREVRLEWAR